MLYGNRTAAAAAKAAAGFDISEDYDEGVFESYIDWTNQYSLRNWITRLNLDCRGDSLVIGFFGSYEFFGQLVACIIFPPLADLFGRRIFTFIGMGL
jgi:MFS family permease